jgi:hypothetical protein
LCTTISCTIFEGKLVVCNCSRIFRLIAKPACVLQCVYLPNKVGAGALYHKRHEQPYSVF